MTDPDQTYLGCHHVAFPFHYPAISNNNETVYKLSTNRNEIDTTENGKIFKLDSKSDQTVQLTKSKSTNKDDAYQHGIIE